METRFLETVLMVAEHGSVAGAARAQGITAAAVSQRLKVLETELGVVLFRRSGKTVQPTAECDRLLPHAREMIQHVVTLTHAVSDNQLAGTLRIGAIGTVMMALLPLTLKHLGKVAPALIPEIYPGTSVDLHDRITRQELDVIVSIAPPFARSKALDARNLRTEPLMLMTPADMSGDVHQILMDNPYIRYDPSSWGGRLTEQYLMRHNLAPKVFCTIDSQETMARMVHEGLGVSLVPDWLRSYEPDLAVRRQKVGDADYDRRIDLVFPRVSPRSALIAAFCDAMTTIHDQQFNARHD